MYNHNKSSNSIALAQANIRRWLNKRVPINAPKNFLNKTDTITLYNMLRKWRIPLIIKSEPNKNWSIIVDEGNGNVNDFYCFYCGPKPTTYLIVNDLYTNYKEFI